MDNNTSPPTDKNLADAVVIAESLARQLDADPAYRAAWKKHASHEARKKLKQARRDIFLSTLEVAAAVSDKEKARTLKKAFNAAIRHTEVMAAPVLEKDPQFEAKLHQYFAMLKTGPGFTADYTQTFEDAGAPRLAALSRKAHAPKA